MKRRGVEVFDAIHPVAGRMLGRLNVLLAEANVPCEQFKEMDEANLELQTAGLAIVVGANDIVNPTAKDEKGSPIYGMPISNADFAENDMELAQLLLGAARGADVSREIIALFHSRA